MNTHGFFEGYLTKTAGLREKMHEAAQQRIMNQRSTAGARRAHRNKVMPEADPAGYRRVVDARIQEYLDDYIGRPGPDPGTLMSPAPGFSEMLAATLARIRAKPALLSAGARQAGTVPREE